MRQDQSERLAASIVEFSRFLRSNGLSADTSQTITALEAAKTIDIANQRIFSFALQSTLCSTKEEWELFPELFDRFWRESQSRPRSASGEHMGSSRSNTQERDDGSAVFLDQPGNQVAAQDGNGKAVYGASAQQRLKKVDFSEVPSADLASLEELSLRLLRRMSQRRSRRLGINTLAERVDLRRRIRRSIMRGGEPIVLAYKGRKPRKNRLVIFLDISGSMNFYSMFLVRFAYALQARFERVHTFLFSTNVVEISDLLRTSNLPDALRRLSQRAAGWSRNIAALSSRSWVLLLEDPMCSPEADLGRDRDSRQNLSNSSGNSSHSSLVEQSVDCKANEKVCWFAMSMVLAASSAVIVWLVSADNPWLLRKRDARRSSVSAA